MALSSIAPASWSAPVLWRFSGVSRPSQSPTGVEHSRTLSRLLLAAFVILHSAFVIAAEPTPPTRTELWLPSSKLDAFLKKNPKAVLLTPEQYNALIRDAGKTEPKVDPALEAPKSLVIEHLDLKGTVEPGATSIMLRGVLTVNVPADGWASGSLAWPYFFDISQTEPPREGPMLAWITQDEFKADKLPAETMRSLSLAVRGPGRRTLHFRGTLPLYYRLRSGERSLDLQHIGCGGQITLTLPEGAELLPGSAVQKKIGYTVTAAFDHRFIRRSDNGDPLTSIPADKKTAGATLPDAVRIRWTDPQHESDIEPLRLIDTGGSMHFGVSDSRLETRLHFAAHVRRGQKGQHETAWPILGGADTQVTAVSGPDVLAWRQNGETLHVTLSQSTAAAPIDIALSRPLVLTAASTLVLPSLKLPLTLAADLHTTEGVDLLALDGLHEKKLRLDAAAAPQITLRPATARLEADVDVAAKLDRDSLRIERTLNLRSDRPVSSVKLVLPEGEEFIAVLRQDQGSISNVSQIAVSNISFSPNSISAPIFADFTWRRVGSAITLLFAKPFTSTGEKIIITSRQKLLKAWSGPKTPETLTLGHLSIPEAVKVAGYTALDFDDSWRVSLKSANGLEDRDARLTPVKGRMAWFGLREHALTVEVERAEAVFSAEVTAYALPRARSIEIEGQFTLDISGAPLRRFQVKLPPATAKLLRVTSPLIGEQQLDEATGLWTLTLRQESKGRQNIRWRMSLAAEAGADSLTTTATLPRLEIPSSRRFTGTWIIEANTDTQLSTQAQGMQPLDVLKAPAVADYAPRHRVTSAFSFGVAEHALTLTAQRHAHSELAPLVITQLRLTSVLDAHGTALHEAHAELLHTGEQFVSLTLPPGAVLLSTLANGEAVKPVRSSGDAIAIPLPAGSANTPTTITLQYRLQTTPWQPSGTLDLLPVQLAPNVPVLATNWLLHTPKTFSITEPETTLEALDAKEVPNVVVAALQSLGVLDLKNSSDGTSTHFQIGPIAYDSITMGRPPMSETRPELAAVVPSIDEGLLKAHASLQTGNYDQAISQFQSVLRLDSQSAAARRGIESAELGKREYMVNAPEVDKSFMKAAADPFAAPQIPQSALVNAEPGQIRLFEPTDKLTSFTTKSGLIPLAVEMPSEGRLLRFAGHQAPPVLHLRYVSWDRQMLVAVLAMLGGMVAFALIAWRRRPWIATLLVIILAALAFPLLLEGDALALANAAAFGWVTMFVVRVLAGVMAWGMERGAWREVSVSGEGVAV
ncbi:MAG: hypothetical protein IPK32_07815 [Verrucomicrobiaceae bacterium]|nr:hypothetical protein [Verrucomicrobiaceae bacterium]